MPQRTYSSTSYRYGFNGKELDNEVKGAGNQLDFGARVYDSRLGRFLSADPLTLESPESSPYSYADNNPIALIDVDGEKGAPGYTIKTNSGQVNVNRPLTNNLTKQQILLNVEERANQIRPPSPPQESRDTKIIRFVKDIRHYISGAQMALTILSMSTHGGGPEGEKVGGIGYYMELQAAQKLLRDQQNNPSNQFEIITSDPSSLPAWYAEEVKQRLMNGTASENDQNYKDELVRRGIISPRFGQQQELGKAASGDILGRNIERVGRVRPPFKHAAHHIVAGKADGANEARQILKNAGIDINDADNGVFLPETNHQRLHSNDNPDYYKKVNDRLKNAAPGKIREELKKIGTELKDGTF